MQSRGLILMHRFSRPARPKEPNVLIESHNLTLDHISQSQHKAGWATVKAMRIREICFKMTRGGNPFWRKAPLKNMQPHIAGLCHFSGKSEI